MRTLRNIFTILLLLLSSSNCGHKELIESHDEKEYAVLNFEVLYKSENYNKYLSDSGTMVYIFYDTSITEVTLYTFLEGKLIHRHGTDIIYPDRIDQVNEKGEYSITPPQNLSRILIYFVSNHFNEIGLKSFFSDNLLNCHQYEQNIKIIFDYSDFSSKEQVLGGSWL